MADELNRLTSDRQSKEEVKRVKRQLKVRIVLFHFIALQQDNSNKIAEIARDLEQISRQHLELESIQSRLKHRASFLFVDNIVGIGFGACSRAVAQIGIGWKDSVARA